MFRSCSKEKLTKQEYHGSQLFERSLLHSTLYREDAKSRLSIYWHFNCQSKVRDHRIRMRIVTQRFRSHWWSWLDHCNSLLLEGYPMFKGFLKNHPANCEHREGLVARSKWTGNADTFVQDGTTHRLAGRITLVRPDSIIGCNSTKFTSLPYGNRPPGTAKTPRSLSRGNTKHHPRANSEYYYDECNADCHSPLETRSVRVLVKSLRPGTKPRGLRASSL